MKNVRLGMSSVIFSVLILLLGVCGQHAIGQGNTGISHLKFQKKENLDIVVPVEGGGDHRNFGALCSSGPETRLSPRGRPEQLSHKRSGRSRANINFGTEKSYAELYQSIDKSRGSNDVANHYSYFPGTVLGLGLGFSPNDLTKANGRAISYRIKREKEGAARTISTVYLVDSRTHLEQALHIDGNISASYLQFSGNSSFDFNTASMFDSESITLVISVFTDWGRLTMEDEHLTAEAKKMAVRSPSMFARTFGTHYIVAEHRGASISAILTIANVSQQVRTKIKVTTEGSGSYGLLSASSQLEAQNELVRASHDGRLITKVVSTGGTGIPGQVEILNAIGSSGDKLSAILGAISKSMQQFNFENSFAIGYDTDSMKRFTPVPDTWTEYKERQLRILGERYHAVEDKIAEIHMTLTANNGGTHILKPGNASKLLKVLIDYEKYLEVAARKHRDFKANIIPDGRLWDLPEVKPSFVVVNVLLAEVEVPARPPIHNTPEYDGELVRDITIQQADPALHDLFSFGYLYLHEGKPSPPSFHEFEGRKREGNT